MQCTCNALFFSPHAHSQDGRRERPAYVDYDEIEALLRGIDYIARLDGSATKFETFEADYRTKGDFVVSTFSDLVATAKARIDSVRGSQ